MTKKKAPGEKKKPGPKGLYGEQTVVLTTKVPGSKKAACRAMIKKWLKQWEIKK